MVECPFSYTGIEKYFSKELWLDLRDIRFFPLELKKKPDIQIHEETPSEEGSDMEASLESFVLFIPEFYTERLRGFMTERKGEPKSCDWFGIQCLRAQEERYGNGIQRKIKEDWLNSLGSLSPPVIK
ncbi:hypothetical protein HYALB_00007560 [Hymenoscyphus albidus]|uniref:Uncharacterized protein n=1 Tax=Hymenoscyphus albidus TaxID=595503 RepID=A0A9N9PUZ5_9HELO|nr:hypothetical protein HYALB_00007560 [Hymenoscyphus albidus]